MEWREREAISLCHGSLFSMLSRSTGFSYTQSIHIHNVHDQLLSPKVKFSLSLSVTTFIDLEGEEYVVSWGSSYLSIPTFVCMCKLELWNLEDLLDILFCPKLCGFIIFQGKKGKWREGKGRRRKERKSWST